MKTLSEQFKENLSLMNKDILEKLYKILELERTRVNFAESGNTGSLINQVSYKAIDLINLDFKDSDIYLTVSKTGDIIISWIDCDGDYSDFTVSPEFFDDFDSYYNKYKQEIENHNKQETFKYNDYLSATEAEQKQREAKKRDKRYQEYLKLKEEFEGLNG